MSKTLYDDWYKEYLNKRNLTEKQDKELEKVGFEALGIKKTKSIKRKLVVDLAAVLGSEYRVEPLKYFDIFYVYKASSGKRILRGRIDGQWYGSPFTGCDTPEKFKANIERFIRNNYSEQDLLHSEEEYQQVKQRIKKLRDLHTTISDMWRNYIDSMPVFGFEPGEFSKTFDRVINLYVDGEDIKIYRENDLFVAEGLFYSAKRNAHRIGREKSLRKLLVGNATTKGGYLHAQMQQINDQIDKLHNYEL